MSPREAPQPVGLGRIPRPLAALAPAALVLLTPLAPLRDQPPLSRSVVIVALVACSALATALRYRWPRPSLAVAVVIAMLIPTLGAFSPGAVIAAAFTAFQSVRTVRRREGAWTTGVAASLVFGATMVASMVHGFDSEAFPSAVVIVLAGALGDASRSRREYIEAIEDRAVRAEQTRDAEARRRVSEERLRIARDLHDAVAHQISVISLNAGVASNSIEADPAKSRAALTTIRAASREVLGEIGDLLAVLRSDDATSADRPVMPDADADAAGARAPQRGLAAYPGLVAQFRRLGFDALVTVEGDLERVSAAADIAGFLVLREALTNAHKHGDGRHADARIAVLPRHVEIVVTNPVASDGGSRAVSSGFGLIGIRERALSVRGDVESGPVPGGYRLAVRLPIRDEGAA